MSEASIKGSAFVGVVEDLKKLAEAGEVSREDLERRLLERDLALLDEEISPGFWYPMASYDRMLDLLVDLQGGDDPVGYLRGRGARAMQRLMDLGIYNQFATLEKGWTRLTGRVMGTMGSVVYNFLTFEIVAERPNEAASDSQAERFTILVKDGGRLSRNAQATIEGATEALSKRAAHADVRVSSSRVATDEVEIYVERADSAA